jgi:hypothetical protein
VVDEAHHLLPARTGAQSLALTQRFPALLLVTVHPGQLAAAILDTIDVVLAVGDTPQRTVGAFAAAVGQAVPQTPKEALAPGEALVWFRRADAAPFRLHAAIARGERQRHQRKYAQGELGEDKGFYFRGPDGRFHLRAQNLMLYLQIADGVDDATWRYHLRRGDYARWFEQTIEDRELAEQAREIERASDLSPAAGRARLREAIERAYTLPA